MKEATELLAKSHCVRPTAAVIVKAGKIIGRGMNAIKNKRPDICPIMTHKRGTVYNLCQEICGQEGHAEVMAIRDALKKTKNLKGANLYLAGHWWVCKPCWDEIIKVGISRVYLNTASLDELRRKRSQIRRKQSQE